MKSRRAGRAKKTARKTSPMVRGGYPILDLPYRYLRTISILTVLYHVFTLAYLYEMIYIAYHLKGHIADYLNMVKEGGYELVYVLVFPALVGIALHVLIVVSALRIITVTTTKIYYYLLFVSVVLVLLLLLIILCLCIYIIVYAYDFNQRSMEILYDSMTNYSLDGLTKMRIDVMQIDLQCCGSRNYTDWYDIEWYDRNFVHLSTEVKVVGETPFSCCNMETIYPCIHHGIMSGATEYKYLPNMNFSLNSEGCWHVIRDRKTRSGWMVVGYLMCHFLIATIGLIPLRILQTASNEKQGFDMEFHCYTAWLWGCYRAQKDMNTATTDINRYILP